MSNISKNRLKIFLRFSLFLSLIGVLIALVLSYCSRGYYQDFEIKDIEQESQILIEHQLRYDKTYRWILYKAITKQSGDNKTFDDLLYSNFRADSKQLTSLNKRYKLYSYKEFLSSKTSKGKGLKVSIYSHNKENLNILKQAYIELLQENYGVSNIVVSGAQRVHYQIVRPFIIVFATLFLILLISLFLLYFFIYKRGRIRDSVVENSYADEAIKFYVIIKNIRESSQLLSTLNCFDKIADSENIFLFGIVDNEYFNSLSDDIFESNIQLLPLGRFSISELLNNHSELNFVIINSGDTFDGSLFTLLSDAFSKGADLVNLHNTKDSMLQKKVRKLLLSTLQINDRFTLEGCAVRGSILRSCEEGIYVDKRELNIPYIQGAELCGF